jgi:transcriptional regulator with XRE-family HTH domain
MGKSQEDVAHPADVSVRHYQKIESGQGDPKISTVLGSADALGVRLQQLLDRVDELQPQRARRR